MKNHAFFKFLAILLCTLSLFCAVIATAGVVTFAEGDLYNKSVDQMLDARLQSDGTVYADYLARQYASAYLGSVPEALIEKQFGHGNWFFENYDPAHYGYAILDAEGNELYGYNVELKNSPSLEYKKALPVEGSYMHLISLESHEDIQQQLQSSREAVYQEEPTLTLYNNLIDAQGVVVNYIAFSDNGELILDAYRDGYSTVVTVYQPDNDTSIFCQDTQVGLLMFDQTRHLVFHSFFTLEEHLTDREVTEVSFRTEDGTSLRLQSPEGKIGTLYYSDSGNIRFLSSQSAVSPEAAEAVLETTVATVPETTPEAVTEATVVTVPETQEEEIWEEEDQKSEDQESEDWEDEPSSASAVPEEGGAETVSPTVAATASATEALAETAAPALPPETLAAETEPVLYNGKPLTEYQLNSASYWDNDTSQTMEAKYIYLPMPEMTVELYLEENAIGFAPLYNILRAVHPYRNYFLPAAACFALLFVLLGVYLITAAGRKPKQEGIRAGGLNRLPLDLYLLAGGAAGLGLIAIPFSMAASLIKTDFYLFCGLTAGALFLACLIFVGFCFAWAAQWKTGGGFVWKNSFCARTLRCLVRVAVALEQFLAAKILPALLWLFKKIKNLLCAVGRGCLLWLKTGLGMLAQGVHRLLLLLPLAWQWVLGGMVLIVIAMLGGAMGGAAILMAVCLCILLILYVAYSFGILADSTRRMSQGYLDTKVDEKNLLGCFKESAADLNALADVAVVAAQKQLKSERMKTELITNVSHDIKTPLTSIINYVDLLQKPHTEEEQAQYLEVLDRQSQRLKKLIDDLMDMSKANTGNMVVEITCLDAVESVNQALGEFAEKLEKAHLTPVFRHSVGSAPILADGKLVWRVMSNLLGNAVKYAMPGTRLYIDLMTLEDKVVISLKNISREELNVNADELMERFVRGDQARNTEGSGLGLNIAKSLMELQKGQLQLLVDGDLFKVTLTFPSA